MKLIDPDGNEVVTTEPGVEALKKAGYSDPKLAKKQSAKKDEAADEATE